MTRDQYLREVEFGLRDLPWSQRRDLVAELREHLAELPPETDLVKRLGKPERYAADLRAAAGLERQRGAIAWLRARRPRNVALVVVALALGLTTIGLGIGAVVWVDHYQPIRDAGFSITPDNAKPSPRQAGYTVFFRKGRPFEYGIGITNDGPYSVRVLSIQRNAPGVPQAFNSFYAARPMMSVSQTCRSLDPLEPFRPFDLKHHACRFLVFKGVYACRFGEVWTRQNSVGVGDFTLRSRFHWKTRTLTIPLDDPLEISFAKEGCPGKS